MSSRYGLPNAYMETLVVFDDAISGRGKDVENCKATYLHDNYNIHLGHMNKRSF